MFKYVLIITFLLNISLFSQNKEFRIYFTDKGTNISLQETAIKNEILSKLNPKAIERRIKTLGMNYLDSFDIPINSKYRDSILKFSAKLLVSSNWFNYIVVNCDTNKIDSIKKLSFVRKIELADSKLQAMRSTEIMEEKDLNLYDDRGNLIYENGAYSYGKSYSQNKLVNSVDFHKIGVNGENITMGFIDTGFKWRGHEALFRANVIGEYDFVSNDSLTYNQHLDHSQQENHGTQTLSTVVGFRQDTLIGIASKAKCYLAKTENLYYERHIEEDNYIAAVEWNESNGVDVLTSSLGYLNFDGQSLSYTFDDLTGRKNLIAKALNIATAKGMVCVTSAGNSGSDPRTIISPADADSVFAIGSIKKDGDTLSRSSSRGPINNSNIKPNFVAQGEQVVTVNPGKWDTYSLVAGTSFSAPSFAGGIALLLSVHPHLKPWEVRKYLEQASELPDNPNFMKGFGRVDFYKAAKLAGSFATQLNSYPIQKFQRFMTFVESEELADLKLFAKLTSNGTFKEYDFLPTNKQKQYVVDIPQNEISVDTIECYFVLNTPSLSERYPLTGGTYYEFPKNFSTISSGVSQDLLQKFVYERESGFFKEQNYLFNPKELSFILQDDEFAKVEFFDVAGNLMSEKNIAKRSAGVVTIDINTLNFPFGIYFARITKNTNIEIIKFINSEMK